MRHVVIDCEKCDVSPASFFFFPFLVLLFLRSVACEKEKKKEKRKNIGAPFALVVHEALNVGADGRCAFVQDRKLRLSCRV